MPEWMKFATPVVLLVVLGVLVALGKVDAVYLATVVAWFAPSPVAPPKVTP